MTAFPHVLSKKLGLRKEITDNSEEKRQKQSVNPCRHFLSALLQRDVSLAFVSDVPDSITRHLEGAKQHVESVG